MEARRNVERLRHKREIQQNNLRIVDSRYQRYGEQQAHGKMKRAGIFATKKRT